VQVRRDVLFKKLNVVAYQTVESATLSCKMRGNRRVELVHWVEQMLQHPEGDFQRVVRELGLDISRIAADLTRSLEKLPRGASAVEDLSPHVDAAMEQAWMAASLIFGDGRVRTGHLLLAMVKDPELGRALRAMSPQFEKLSADKLGELFGGALQRAPEAALSATTTSEASEASPASADIAPAALGKQEALNKFSVDLTERARRGEIDPVTGRDNEMRQIVDILMRRRQNNPILTGEAGVGKTAVVEGFALRIAAGDVPPPLREVTLRSLDIGLLQAGASMKGEFEQRLRQVIEEVQASPKPIILFIDEAHTLIGAGGAAGTGDAANLLKPALARGTLRTIAATTWAEYKKHIEKDPALTRRFQVVQVPEPSEEVAVRMMRGMAAMLEKHHRVQVLDEALEASVKLAHRYIPARQLPDKSVSLLDTACARVAVSQHATPPALEDCLRQLEALDVELAIIEREDAVGVAVAKRRANVDAALIAERERRVQLEARWESEKKLVDRILALRASLRRSGAPVDALDSARAKEAMLTVGDLAAQNALEPSVRADMLTELNRLNHELATVQGDAPLILPTVDAHAVGSVVSDWTGIPVGRMVSDEIQAVLNLSQTLKKRVIGQQHSLELIAQRIQTTRAGLEDPRKPIGVFMLAGPSGVGKTETALALAEALFGGEQSLITINMSEFQESHTVSSLKGAPPGYVGYGEGGVLTEAVRRRPYSVVLLDEVEKAHPDVHELFFQVFDKGFMDDGEGRTIDFKNTLILLTSNAGSDVTMKLCRDPGKLPDVETLRDALRPPLLDIFPPALLGRLVVIPYFPLSDEMIRSIVQLQLGRIVKRLDLAHGIALRLDDSVAALIAARCTELESGARMIESLLSNTLLPRLSQEILRRMVGGLPSTVAQVSTEDGDFTYAVS
jgi:type VI secretion system protein VasG